MNKINNMIKKIMNSKYRYVFVGIIIMIVVFCLGLAMIQGMNNFVIDKGVTSADVVVSEKYLDDNNFYIIVSNNNQTFDIKKDNNGEKMYDKLIIGKHYRFTIQNDTKSPTTHIIQVYNGTN